MGSNLGLQLAVDVVDGELMVNERVGEEHFIVPSPRPAIRDIGELRPFPRYGVKSFCASGGRSEKEPAQEPGPGQREKTCIGASSRAKSGDGFRLFSIDDAQESKLPEQAAITLLWNH